MYTIASLGFRLKTDSIKASTPPRSPFTLSMTLFHVWRGVGPKSCHKVDTIRPRWASDTPNIVDIWPALIEPENRQPRDPLVAQCRSPTILDPE